MIAIKIDKFADVLLRVLRIAQTIATEGEHIEAVLAVGKVEVAVPYKKVGEGYREIVHLHLVVIVLLAVAYKAVEIRAGFIFHTECAEGEAGVENLVGLGIVVVHCRSRFGRAESSFGKAFTSFFHIAFSLIAETEQVVKSFS